MKNLKSLLYVVGAASTMTLAFSPAANANSANYNGSIPPQSYNGTVPHSKFSGQHFNAHASNISANHKQILNGSDTASFYYRVGVKNYDNGNLDKAEKAFVSVLLADGLDQQALYYLAHISEKQGDKFKMEKYARAFHGLDKK